MGEGRSLRTSEYFSLGHIYLIDLQQTEQTIKGMENHPS